MSGSYPSILAASLALAAACSPSRVEDAGQAPAGTAAPADTSAPLPTMTVYKTPSCGCCKKWVEHVQAAGFAVEVHDLDDLSEIKAEAGVPGNARSCHTAIVDGYAIEGHVPAETIKRLLRERPEVAGLAVPGMPTGSPGMEVPGEPGKPGERYDVVAYDRAGVVSVYARH